MFFCGWMITCRRAIGRNFVIEAIDEQWMDPIAWSAVRVAIAALAQFIIYGWTARGAPKDYSVRTRTIILKTVGSDVIGVGAVMTLVMFALTGGEASTWRLNRRSDCFSRN